MVGMLLTSSLRISTFFASNNSKLLYPQEISDKLDNMTAKINSLTSQLEAKEARIVKLDERLVQLEGVLDNQEQYTRGANLRIQGIPESDQGESTDEKTLEIVNDFIGLDPPLQLEDIERSHRVGSRIIKQTGNPTACCYCAFQK